VVGNNLLAILLGRRSVRLWLVWLSLLIGLSLIGFSLIWVVP
jgi:hypothetical protein